MKQRLKFSTVEAGRWVAIAIALYEVFLTPPPIDPTAGILAGIFYGATILGKA